MEIRALINIKLTVDPSTNVSNLLANIRAVPGVDWVSIVFGPDVDAVAYVKAASQDDIAEIAVKIRGLAGVGSTATQILADV